MSGPAQTKSPVRGDHCALVLPPDEQGGSARGRVALPAHRRPSARITRPRPGACAGVIDDISINLSGPAEIGAFAIGVVAFGVQVASYQGRTGTRIMGFLALAGTLWVAHFTVMGQWVSGLILGVSVVRNILAVLGARTIIIAGVGSLALMPALGEAMTGSLSWATGLAASGAALGTLAVVLHRRTNAARLGLAGSSVVWLAHHIVIGSLPAAVSAVTMIVSNLVGWVRNRPARLQGTAHRPGDAPHQG